MTSHGIIRSWDFEDGQGVIDSIDTPGGCRVTTWPRWRDAYLDEYKKDGPLDIRSGDGGTGVAGGANSL